MGTLITLSQSELLLSIHEGVSKKTIILFLPGISGKAFSERFQPLVDLSLENRVPIARMRAWENEEDVQLLSYTSLHAALSEALDRLLLEGFSEVIAIGKSFGGGLLLSYHDVRIVKKILWAPAIGTVEEGNFEKLMDTKLRDITQLLNVQLSSLYLSEDPSEICIIHGTADDVIPFANSETILMSVSRGKLGAIEGAGHSFASDAEEQKLLQVTHFYLQS